MIDFENPIFREFYPSVSELCAEGGVRSVYTPSPSKFPSVVFREMDNFTVRQFRDSSREEQIARVTYVFDVTAQSKAEARQVFKAGDDKLMAMNFTRLGSPFTDDSDNPRICRIVGRYEADIDRNGMIYRS